MARKIPLTNGLEAIVDDGDFELVNQYNWCHRIQQNGLIYAVRTERIGEKKVCQYMHQLILDLASNYHGDIDHLNGDGLDDRRANLLPRPHARNLLNAKLNKRNKVGLKGVSWNKQAGKWEGYVHSNYKKYSLGLWETPEEAHAAYRLILEAYYEADYDRDICSNKGQSHLSEQHLEILRAFKKTDKWRRRRRPQTNSTSGYIGVHWHKRDRCWEAYAVIDQKQYYVGRFDNAETAHAARCAFLKTRIGPDRLPGVQRMLKQ